MGEQRLAAGEVWECTPEVEGCGMMVIRMEETSLERRIFMKMRCPGYSCHPNSFGLFSFPSRRIRRPDPTGRLILVGDGRLFNATAYAVEPILRGDLGEREIWGSWRKEIVQPSRILINWFSNIGSQWNFYYGGPSVKSRQRRQVYVANSDPLV